MSMYRKCRGKLRVQPKLPWLSAMRTLLLLLYCSAGRGQTAPDSSTELTLAQFRGLVATRLSETSRAATKSREKPPPPDLRPAEELFGRLLQIQARSAAAHQSLDRLAGWSKAIQARFQTQNAPQLDVDVARFEEARMAAESARLETERKRLVERANALLGRPAEIPLVALLPLSSAEVPNGVDKQQKEALAQGEELVTKMYKSYQFGGMAVTALMAYEKVLYEFELEYRQQVARDAMKPAAE
ncbi:MAG: hypothetical protein HY651_02765 [Acidobacteria bacterium]|nr:hypothetical protein [Acidobacteriota bacterium]